MLASRRARYQKGRLGETVRYVAHHRGRWLALAVFSAPALKCGARDRWIGWGYGVQFGRLHLLTNNSRFLILPGGLRNLGSRVLSLCTRRLVSDWPARFGHEVLLAETFVDPARFRGSVYRAANWIEVGRTRGFARNGHGYSEHARPKLVFLHPLSTHPGRPRPPPARHRAHRCLFARGPRPLRARLRHPPGPPRQGTGVGGDRNGRSRRPLHRRHLPARPQSPLHHPARTRRQRLRATGSTRCRFWSGCSSRWAAGRRRAGGCIR